MAEANVPEAHIAFAWNIIIRFIGAARVSIGIIVGLAARMWAQIHKGIDGKYASASASQIGIGFESMPVVKGNGSSQ